MAACSSNFPIPAMPDIRQSLATVSSDPKCHHLLQSFQAKKLDGVNQ